MVGTRKRNGRGNPFTLAILTLTVIGGVAGYYLFPMHWNYWNMKQLTRESAREWIRSKKVEFAKSVLVTDMKKKGIDDDEISIKDCRFRDSRSSFQLICEWTSYVEIPLRDAPLMKEFSINVEVDGAGNIEQW